MANQNIVQPTLQMKYSKFQFPTGLLFYNFQGPISNFSGLGVLCPCQLLFLYKLMNFIFLSNNHPSLLVIKNYVNVFPTLPCTLSSAKAFFIDSISPTVLSILSLSAGSVHLSATLRASSTIWLSALSPKLNYILS